MRRLRTRILGTLALAAVGLNAVSAMAAPAKQLIPLKYEEVIRSIFYLPSYVALAKGYFKDEGLDVSMKTSWGSDKGVAALLSGTADVVLVGPETTVYIQNQDSPVKVKAFAGLTGADGSFLIGRKAMPNFKWGNLKGSTIMSWRIGSSPDLYLRHVLAQHGLDPNKDVKIISNLAAPARHGAFVAGSADYATFYEPDVSTMLKAGQAYYLGSIGREAGDIDETVFVATDNLIKTKPEVVQAWTNAIYRAQKYSLQADPKELAKLVSGYFPKVDLDIIASSIERYRDLGIYKKTPVITPGAIKGLQEVLIEGHLLKKDKRVKFDDVVTNKFAKIAVEKVAAK